MPRSQQIPATRAGENEESEVSNAPMTSMSTHHHVIKEQECLIVKMNTCLIRISHSFDEKLIHC